MTRQIKKLGPGFTQPPAPAAAPPPESERTVVIPHDVVNEAVVLSHMACDGQSRARFVHLIPADRFQDRVHREAFSGFSEIERRKLTFDRGTLAAVAGEPVAQYVFDLAQARGASQNVDWHVSNMFWDAARIAVASGPLPAFIEALRDPRADPERVRALGRAIPNGFDGHDDRRYIRRPEELIREMMLEVERRVGGGSFYPFGIDGLDYFEDGKRRLSVGAMPGLITTITAVTGGGKSSLTLHIVLGLAGWRRQPDGTYERTGPRRKILYGAWEMLAKTLLELLAIITLGWSRGEVRQGKGPVATEEGRHQLRRRTEEISEDVVMLENPFQRRRGEKGSNERNLDVVQGYIADCGCDVFVADLWARLLVETKPDEEAAALERQQAMALEQRVHCILLQQQRFKDIEMRQDKRPTREGIMGSGAWVSVSDNVIAPHWPFLFKKVDPGRLEVFVLKQREGAWPLGIEFNWDAEGGRLWGGRSVEYDRPGEASEVDSFIQQHRGIRRPQ